MKIQFGQFNNYKTPTIKSSVGVIKNFIKNNVVDSVNFTSKRLYLSQARIQNLPIEESIDMLTDLLVNYNQYSSSQKQKYYSQVAELTKNINNSTSQDFLDDKSGNLLELAIDSNDLELVKILIQNGVDPYFAAPSKMREILDCTDVKIKFYVFDAMRKKYNI